MLNTAAGRRWADKNREYLKKYVTLEDDQRVVYLWDTHGRRTDQFAPEFEPVKTTLDLGRTWFKNAVSGFVSVDPAGDVALVEHGECFIKNGPTFGIWCNVHGENSRLSADKNKFMGICARSGSSYTYEPERLLGDRP